MAYEEPVYTVIEKKGNIEIRRYEPYKLWFLRRNEVLIPVEKVPGD